MLQVLKGLKYRFFPVFYPFDGKLGLGPGANDVFMESAGMDDDVAFPASIFLFAGIALVAAFFLSKKVNGNN